MQVSDLEIRDEEIAILGKAQARALSELADEEIAILTSEDTRLTLLFDELCGKQININHHVIQSIGNLMATSSYPSTPQPSAATGAALGTESADHYNSVVRFFGKLVVATNKVDEALRTGTTTPNHPVFLRFLRQIYAVHKSPRHVCSFPAYMEQQIARWGPDVAKQIFDA